MVAPDSEKSRLDEAARAGWLYFIAGHTQDEIAKMLQVSRASAQRLVSLCLAERLITFRLEHPIARVRAVAAKADLRLVGVGQMDRQAQVHVDGFVSREELLEMMRLGAVGELIGWAFDEEGHLIKGGTNLRLTSIPPQVPAEALTIGAAVGRAKASAIRAALKGRVLDRLITDAATARAILQAERTDRPPWSGMT